MSAISDGLAMPLELNPGELLDELLQRADPAGQRDERVGAVEHDLLALMHVVDHDEFAPLERSLFALLTEIWG